MLDHQYGGYKTPIQLFVLLIISSSTSIGVYNMLGSPGNRTTGWIAACFTDIAPAQLLVYTVIDRAGMLDHIYHFYY